MSASSAAPAWKASSAAGLPLRMAQRAFAALLEGGERGEFVAAQLRSAARRTLSALSADEQSELMRWLSLQLASREACDAINASSPLARVDAMLAAGIAAGIAAALPRTREELLVPACKDAVAA